MNTSWKLEWVVRILLYYFDFWFSILPRYIYRKLRFRSPILLLFTTRFRKMTWASTKLEIHFPLWCYPYCQRVSLVTFVDFSDLNYRFMKKKNPHACSSYFIIWVCIHRGLWRYLRTYSVGSKISRKSAFELARSITFLKKRFRKINFVPFLFDFFFNIE